MWLGSYQQLKNVDITDIPILSMQVKVSESACDLGVVLDNQLLLSSHVAALCRAGFSTFDNYVQLFNQLPTPPRVSE